MIFQLSTNSCQLFEQSDIDISTRYNVLFLECSSVMIRFNPFSDFFKNVLQFYQRCLFIKGSVVKVLTNRQTHGTHFIPTTASCAGKMDLVEELESTENIFVCYLDS